MSSLVLTLAVAVTLAAPGDLAPFSEEAAGRGVSYVPAPGTGFGRGLAFVDLDDDGDADLVVTGRADGHLGLFENDGRGQFIDHTGLALASIPSAGGVSAADYDHDGDLDIYVSVWGQPNRLLRNDGGFVFTDAAVVAGVDDTRQSTGTAWGDYDGDGWLDLYVSNWNGANRLYRNLGENGAAPIGFVDVAQALGVEADADPTFQATFSDYDRDGDPDLYIASDRGTGCEENGYYNHLWRNDGGVFVDVTEAAGVEACLDAMCIAIGDFDGNALPDFYCTNTPPGNGLFSNRGDGTFSRDELAAGVASFAVGWGAVFVDFDNDAWQDLFVCNLGAPNRLYRHTGRWPAEDLAAPLGVAHRGSTYTVAAADIDGDGDVDLAVSSLGEPIRVLVNHMGGDRAWTRLDIRGTSGRRHAVGASVVVRTGTTDQLREVIAGCNYKSQNELVVHVGLDDHEAMDAVEITWRDGTTRTLTNLPARQRWTIDPPDRLGDADRDGDRDLDDFHVMLECLATGVLTPGCELMDLTGDSVIDLADVEAFIVLYDGGPADCDADGVHDLWQIASGAATDGDGDGRLDGCEAGQGDLNGDLRVDSVDLAMLLGVWGQPDVSADLDGSGVVDFADLLRLLSYWG